MEDLKYRWNEFYCPGSLSSLIEFSQVHVSPNATLTQRHGLVGRHLSRFVSAVVNMGEEFIPLYSLNHRPGTDDWAWVSQHRWGGSRDRRPVKDPIGQEGKAARAGSWTEVHGLQLCSEVKQEPQKDLCSAELVYVARIMPDKKKSLKFRRHVLFGHH